MLHSFLLVQPDFRSPELDFLLESFDKHVVLHCLLIPQAKNYRLLITSDYFEYSDIHSHLSEYGVYFFGWVVSLSQFSLQELFIRYKQYANIIFSCYVSASSANKE